MNWGARLLSDWFMLWNQFVQNKKYAIKAKYEFKAKNIILEDYFYKKTSKKYNNFILMEEALCNTFCPVEKIDTTRSVL